MSLLDKFTVYMHICPNSKKYIGITGEKDASWRWGDGGSGYKQNTHFWSAIQKYGWNNIEHIIVAENLSKEDACQLEIDLIAEHKSNDRRFGYNHSTGGEKSALGFHHSEEAKRKIGDASKNREHGPMSDKTKEKLRQINLGKKASPELKKKLSDIQMGHPVTEETRRKISASNKGKSRNKGTHMSDESKQKLSKSLKGHIVSEETKQKISNANKGHIMSEDQKQKLSESLKGRKKPPRTKEHIENWKKSMAERRRQKELSGGETI